MRLKPRPATPKGLIGAGIPAVPFVANCSADQVGGRKPVPPPFHCDYFGANTTFDFFLQTVAKGRECHACVVIATHMQHLCDGPSIIQTPVCTGRTIGDRPHAHLAHERDDRCAIRRRAREHCRLPDHTRSSLLLVVVQASSVSRRHAWGQCRAAAQHRALQGVSKLFHCQHHDGDGRRQPASEVKRCAYVNL